MILFLFLGLVLGGFGVVFAFQNNFEVTVTFLGWELTGSLAVVIVISLLVGVVISVLMTMPRAIKNYFVISGLKKENNRLAKELSHAQKMEIISPPPQASQPPQA